MSETKSAADTAYVTVKELIVSGELPGGELVSEGEIATRLEISRTPVREAFLRLQVEGWMRLYPKRGALVVPIAVGEAESVVDARRLVEAGSVRAFIDDASARESVVSALRENLRLQEELAVDGTAAQFSAVDADFHRTVVRAGGNPLLDAFYDGLRERQRRMTAASVTRDPGQISRIVDDHRRLADLIEAGDADGFERAVEQHMLGVHGLRPDRGGAR
ncbi:GntR family transcriptional regulator [Rhodococcus sp. IEGM 1401]|uniref:GntR family transcriptional regulator n=1 Tax=unclassified Rhodococcus (in: high G+C Gram-positive bacteria) TaxID=192944 RepID=UPI0022B58A16|nr:MULTISPECIES: GntR family transcriptional regulator [unclassified Rhodococcus (in: high G+C Gram-positive bacteria)]MCZ4562839.1 GntR family transcriptional regulator [Rhodococcus sp. IEGM 1401]MDI9922962.1 GntR family transcriptional regulator [Rhodococcus sp. IEGM 1372]MDV8035446.1 GntR family transcriptional regulator [Rhodococcus sp. IEGM 1414]